MLIRDLELLDFDKGILSLLEQLTVVGGVSRESFAERFKELQLSPDYKTLVVEDPETTRIVATATLLVERKLIRACGKAGHIEDVVVDEAYRGHRLGQRLIEELLTAAKEAGCYKVILDCAQRNAPFYQKCGFAVKEVQMAKYF